MPFENLYRIAFGERKNSNHTERKEDVGVGTDSHIEVAPYDIMKDGEIGSSQEDRDGVLLHFECKRQFLPQPVVLFVGSRINGPYETILVNH